MTLDIDRAPEPDAEADRSSDRPSVAPLRIVAFIGVCAVAVAISAVALVTARNDPDALPEGVAPVEVASVGPAAALADDTPDLLFQSTAFGETYGYAATLPADGSSDRRAVSDLQCERVHFRAGRGVCLFADRGFATTYEAQVFGSDLSVEHTIGLAGAPSRVRVSPSGDLAGATVFVTGHSYAQAGFSTQTILVDLDGGTVIADLETDFAVFDEGRPWREIDFNFWGVTFVDDERFYATLSSGGEYFLVEGTVSERRLDIVTDHVECPSLSPDGTRLAYKARIDNGFGPVSWQLMVIDLDDLERTELAESRSVDDQVAWLDDDTVMYGRPDDRSPAQTNTWVVAADGTGQPELLIEGAWSAAVVDAG